MFIITSFNPFNSGPVTSGTFNTTFNSQFNGKMVVRNHTYVTLVISINNLASLTSKIPPGASHVYNASEMRGYPVVYWSVDQTELLKTIALQKIFNSSLIVVEGYEENEMVPDSTSFFPRSTQTPVPLIDPLDMTVVSTIQPNSTSAHTTTLSVVASTGLWLVQLEVHFGVPTAAINEDCTVTDVFGGPVLQYHINMGIAPMPPGVINSVFNPPLPFRLNGTSGQVSFNTPATTSGPGYSVTIYAMSN